MFFIQRPRLLLPIAVEPELVQSGMLSKTFERLQASFQQLFCVIDVRIQLDSLSDELTEAAQHCAVSWLPFLLRGLAGRF